MTYQMTKRLPFRDPQRSPRTDETGDRTDTDYYMEPDAEANSGNLSPTDVNPRDTKYDLRHIPKPNRNDDYRY